MKEFRIPVHYKSQIISKIKEIRRINDPRKNDYSPTILNFGPVTFYLARHFGFCYGVENAIEISYRAVEENPGKRIFLLSQMIHNPEVNHDLAEKGIRFIMNPEGVQYYPWEELIPEDIVIIPAFGTTPQIEEKLRKIGIEVYRYNTTCPFVERVWKKSEKLGSENFSIIVHGKHNHEETRATFSRSELCGPSLILKDINEARKLASVILGEIDKSEFYSVFQDRYSKGFDVSRDLERIGVVNQTTMLASETQEISEFLRDVLIKKYGAENLSKHYADTRDTLCYATNENQLSTYSLLDKDADMAIVVGGYNSSNTSHLVELCELKLPTYFISSEKELLSETAIRHYNCNKQEIIISENYLPKGNKVEIILTSGASCPDSIVEKVMLRVISFFENTRSKEDVLGELIKSSQI